MNRTEQILLQAIRKSLWKQPADFPADTDWDAVLKEAEEQTILGIVAPVAPKAVQERWKSKTCAVTAAFLRILHAQDALCKLLKANDIPVVILKGMASAIYYPDPLQRSMGDIDFLIPLEHFDRAKSLLAQNGYAIREKLNYPRHIDLRKNGVSFEMHRYFSHTDVDIEEDIIKGVQQAETAELYGYQFPVLPESTRGLVLLAHLAHHIKSGLGFRQVIDWMQYADRIVDDAYWERSFHSRVKQVGLETTAVTVTKMCQLYFGLKEDIHWCDAAEIELCEQMMRNLLSSGNFGIKNGTGTRVEVTISRFQRIGIRYLQRAGEYNWQAYQKHHWLKSFAWAYQIGRYAKQAFCMRRSKTQLKDDMERGKQRSELINRLRIGKKSE